MPRYSEDGTQLLEVGKAPGLMERVTASLAMKRPGSGTVRVLDHMGRRTRRTVPVRGHEIRLDGAATHAIYYEVRFEQ